MNKVDSFAKDHTILKSGLYGCPQRHPYVVTYDLRFTTPNGGDYLSQAVMHSIEHLMVTYLKEVSPYADEVISFCPGACGTMFYLELVDSHKMPLQQELCNAIDWCLKQDKVPGATKESCGNYKSHNRSKALSRLWMYKKQVLEVIPASRVVEIVKSAHNNESISSCSDGDRG